jgi:hypothetical protein
MKKGLRPLGVSEVQNSSLMVRILLMTTTPAVFAEGGERKGQEGYCCYRYIAIIQYMAKATLILATRDDYPERGIVVAKRIYRLAEPNADAPHGYSYRLHCGILDGQTLVRFDNETGKGDHVHWGDTEQSYSFTTPDQLLADFATAIRPCLEP